MEGCTQRACTALMRRECHKQINEINHQLATIVPALTDEKGAPVTHAQLTMDGRVVASQIDGRPVAVDPGEHEFAFKTDTGASAPRKVALAQGERNKPVAATLGARKDSDLEFQLPPPPPAGSATPATNAPASATVVPDAKAEAPVQQVMTDDEPPRRNAVSAPSRGGSRAGAYILGGLGLLGLGGYGVLTYWGNQDNRDLAQCKPNCPAANIDHIRQTYFFADVSAGVGIAALAASTWLFITSGPSSSTSSKDKAASGRRGVALDVRPTSSGAFASVSGAF
jgi:hypothetical protein